MFIKRIIYVVVLTLICSSLQAADFLTVDGPTEAVPGALTSITVGGTAKQYKWSVVPDNKRAMGFYKNEDGIRSLLFAIPESESGVYVFVIAASDEKTLELKSHVVTVGTPAPPTPPAPVTVLTQSVRSWSAGLPNKATVSRIFTEQANVQYTTLEDLLSRTVEANRKLITPADLPIWTEKFFTPLEPYLSNLYDTNPNTDFVAVWREIGKALQ